MRVDLPQISPTRIESEKTKRKTSVQRPSLQNTYHSAVKNDVDEISPFFSAFGPGGTYSIASLLAAAEHQSRYFAVAENNILAAQSASRIPKTLLRQLNPDIYQDI